MKRSFQNYGVALLAAWVTAAGCGTYIQPHIGTNIVSDEDMDTKFYQRLPGLIGQSKERVLLELNVSAREIRSASSGEAMKVLGLSTLQDKSLLPEIENTVRSREISVVSVGRDFCRTGILQDNCKHNDAELALVFREGQLEHARLIPLAK